MSFLTALLIYVFHLFLCEISSVWVGLFVFVCIIVSPSLFLWLGGILLMFCLEARLFTGFAFQYK